MGTLFGFAVGYVIGARAGSVGFEEVVQAIRDIRDSEEFRGFVDAMRSHARHTAGSLAQRLAGEVEVVPYDDPEDDDYGVGGDHRPKLPM